MLASDASLLELRHGEVRLVVAARAGAVLAFEVGNAPVFQPASPRTDPFPFANFVMAPFSNRIADSKFYFRGRWFEVAANVGVAHFPLPIHGFGWQAEWDLEPVSSREARLVWACSTSEWPQPFRVEQHLRLTGDGYIHGLRISNCGTGPMPAGLGLHPYFPAGAVRIDAAFDGSWITGADGIPRRWEALEGSPDWFGGKAIDQGFTGRDGPVRVHYPDRTVTIEPDPVFRDTMVYIPNGLGHFCIEPVTHHTNAINGPDGMFILYPGESLQGSVRFSATFGAVG